MSRGKRSNVARCSCIECKREFSNVGLITHLLRSHDKDTRFASSGHTKGNPGHKGANQYTKAKERGEKCEVSESTRSKIRVGAIEHNSTFWTTEQRDRHSDIMLETVKKNPESYNYSNVCRRVGRFTYKDNYLHSSWEVEVAKYLDENFIKWTRKTKSFDYLWEGKTRQYFPDFYLPDLDVYVEVKGYEIEKDRVKWSQFPRKLVIIKGEEYNKIVDRSFDIRNFGM